MDNIDECCKNHDECYGDLTSIISSYKIDLNWKCADKQLSDRYEACDNCVPLCSKKAWWRKRASFVDYHVWVTPYDEKERFGGGNYPNQSQGDGGLLKYTEKDRSIVDKDIVLWYTFGVTHIPRQEDFPVMPVVLCGFTLKPNGFFDINPASDIPKPIKKTDETCCKN
ncbi:unnamed protein product [Rotaria sp. Silwood1]|nr:unnamed protein product [Rotaria sp. Silwood1]CAF1229244.1 unnamed protein product [Rotaria sp. Silwood1]